MGDDTDDADEIAHRCGSTPEDDAEDDDDADEAPEDDAEDDDGADEAPEDDADDAAPATCTALFLALDGRCPGWQQSKHIHDLGCVVVVIQRDIPSWHHT